MIISLDIYNNKVVRLYKGNLNKIKYFGYFYEYIDFYLLLNIKKIHVVILDNIFKKTITNISVKEKNIIQIGGGLKNKNDLKYYIKKNINKFVLSTIIINDKLEFKKILSIYKKQILISLDCYNNFICINGWVTQTFYKIDQLVTYLYNIGIKTIIYTNILKDGTLSGIKIDNLFFLKKYKNLCNFIISGGISCIEDVLKLKNKLGFNSIIGISLYKFLIKLSSVCFV